MPPLTPEAYAELVRSPCSACRRQHLKVRAFAPGSLLLLDGEPVSSITWTYEPESLPGRVYRVECSACGAVLWEQGDCPGCGARGGLSRALDARHGLEPPATCTRCEHSELKVTAEQRLRLDLTAGAVSRRVADAEPHEPGFHVVRVDCPVCERAVAELGGRCALCGRSSLLKKMR